MANFPFGILKISGPDTKQFLQGQLTYNLEHITDSSSHIAALCNRQGRVISLFEISLLDGNYYLIMHREMVPVTINTLQKYAQFYKTTLEVVTSQLAGLTSIIDFENLRFNHFSSAIPCIYPSTSGVFLPHELNLQEHNIISFDKGCFTGQEIIARMHYRGKTKTHLHQAMITTTNTPTPGDQICTNQGVCGSIVDVYPNDRHYDLLIVCNDSQSSQLFIQNQEQNYIIVKDNQR